MIVILHISDDVFPARFAHTEGTLNSIVIKWHGINLQRLGRGLRSHSNQLMFQSIGGSPLLNNSTQTLSQTK